MTAPLLNEAATIVLPQRGLPGDRGPRGEAGPEGERGPQGPAGAVAYATAAEMVAGVAVDRAATPAGVAAAIDAALASLASIVARLSALEALAVEARLSALEAASASPMRWALPTSAAFGLTLIPSSVLIVETMGGATAGDGRGAWFRRSASGVVQDASGAKWEAFFPLAAAFALLPQVEDGAPPVGLSAGDAYLNGTFVVVNG